MTKTYLKVHEVGCLEKTATYLRGRLLVRLLFRLGRRISVSLAIRVKDIYFDQVTLY